MFEATNS